MFKIDWTYFSNIQKVKNMIKYQIMPINTNHNRYIGK